MKSEKQIEAKLESMKESMCYLAPELRDQINWILAGINALKWVLKDNNMGIDTDDQVEFTGCDESQHNFGGNTGDYKSLEIGATYTVDYIDVHSYHTKVYLKGIEGSFNSVCFNILK